MKVTSIDSGRRKGRLVATLMLAALAILSFSDRAAAAGGASIASAPTAVFGEQTFGNTEDGEYQCGPGEFWLLSMRAGDKAAIDWEATERRYAYRAAVYPPGTTDYSLGNANQVAGESLSSNNHGELIFSAGSSSVYPLVFVGEGCKEDHLGGPYDFTVHVQHGLVPTLKNYKHIKATTVVTATVSLADGSPVPDGLGFALTVSWSGRESVTYTATTAAGALAFPLALPETALGKVATLTVTRPADGSYQEASSAKLEVKVGRGTTSTTKRSPCEIEEARLRSLKRQYKRLKYHSLLAHGAQRRRLKNHARRVHRALKFVRGEAATACGTA